MLTTPCGNEPQHTSLWVVKLDDQTSRNFMWLAPKNYLMKLGESSSLNWARKWTEIRWRYFCPCSQTSSNADHTNSALTEHNGSALSTSLFYYCCWFTRSWLAILEEASVRFSKGSAMIWYSEYENLSKCGELSILIKTQLLFCDNITLLELITPKGNTISLRSLFRAGALHVM